MRKSVNPPTTTFPSQTISIKYTVRATRKRMANIANSNSPEILFESFELALGLDVDDSCVR